MPFSTTRSPSRRILFPGRTNNHMLFLIMELKGKFNHKMLKKAKFHEQHFDERLEFLNVDKNVRNALCLPCLSKAHARAAGEQGNVNPLNIPSKATHDLRARLMPVSAMKKLKEEEVRLLGHFVDLLEKMLSLEGAKRPSPKVSCVCPPE